MFSLLGDKIIWSVSILLFVASILLVYSSGGSESLGPHITHLIMGLGLIFIFSSQGKVGSSMRVPEKREVSLPSENA